MHDDAALPPKIDVARALLLKGSVFVYLDPRREGTLVPDHLRAQPQLVLQIGLDLAVPIPDLRIDDEGVTATLSFNRTPFACRVPWSAIFGLVGDDAIGVVWREDLPDEIEAEVEQAVRRAEAKKAGHLLRAIPGGGSDTQRPSEDAPERPPHLRLVK